MWNKKKINSKKAPTSLWPPEFTMQKEGDRQQASRGRDSRRRGVRSYLSIRGQRCCKANTSGADMQGNGAADQNDNEQITPHWGNSPSSARHPFLLADWIHQAQTLPTKLLLANAVQNKCISYMRPYRAIFVHLLWPSHPLEQLLTAAGVQGWNRKKHSWKETHFAFTALCSTEPQALHFGCGKS